LSARKKRRSPRSRTIFEGKKHFAIAARRGKKNAPNFLRKKYESSTGRGGQELTCRWGGEGGSPPLRRLWATGKALFIFERENCPLGKEGRIFCTQRVLAF